MKKVRLGRGQGLGSLSNLGGFEGLGGLGVAVLLLLPVAASHAQIKDPAVVRVVCVDDSAGAEISVNEVFKGDCPLDIPVSAGTVKLRAFKKIDESRESVFETEFRMAGGTVKRVEVELGAPRLNAAAAKRDEEARRKQEDERKQAAEARAREAAAELATLRLKATAGDADAMLTLAETIEAGQGEPTDERAAFWYSKAAAAGNAYASFVTSDYYPRAKVSAQYSANALREILKRPTRGGERAVSAVGTDAIRQLVATDPFFAMTGQGQTGYRIAANDDVMHDRTCTAAGRNFQFDGNINVKNPGIGSRDHTVKGEAALGGLLFIHWKSNRLFESREVVATQVDRLWGQPFPLNPAERFGLSFTVHDRSDAWDVNQTTSYVLMCGVDKTRAGQLPRSKPVLCLVSSGGKPVGLFNTSVSDDTGCAARGFRDGEIRGLAY